jgi:hypothetical protein
MEPSTAPTTNSGQFRKRNAKGEKNSDWNSDSGENPFIFDNAQSKKAMRLKSLKRQGRDE